MARKASNKKFREQLKQLDRAENNIVAISQGPRRKSWSVHDIKNVKGLNDTQRSLIQSYYTGNHIVAGGSAGAGKTFLAMWLALNTIFSKEYNQSHIIIVRSAVPSREIGFLPGTAEEKLEPYELPYKDIMHELLGKPSSYDDLKEAGRVHFVPTSFVRGTTWDDAVIIIDEAQNMTIGELNSVMTRVGVNSRIIVCGDLAQNDLVNKRNETSGFTDFLRIVNIMPEMDVFNFTTKDIVRSPFVKAWITAKEDLGL
jgi:phosphate starvation-inducible protein PhoH and related proteins